ncbi:hypothetical protein [Heyndrickxia oleronia]|nr:hypothetical protein [Heyndrickxia oleronia]
MSKGGKDEGLCHYMLASASNLLILRDTIVEKILKYMKNFLQTEQT